MLFWKDLNKTLRNRGFIVNPYGQCVANKLIGGNNVQYCGTCVI